MARLVPGVAQGAGVVAEGAVLSESRCEVGRGWEIDVRIPFFRPRRVQKPVHQLAIRGDVQGLHSPGVSSEREQHLDVSVGLYSPQIEYRLHRRPLRRSIASRVLVRPDVRQSEDADVGRVVLDDALAESSAFSVVEDLVLVEEVQRFLLEKTADDDVHLLNTVVREGEDSGRVRQDDDARNGARRTFHQRLHVVAHVLKGAFRRKRRNVGDDDEGWLLSALVDLADPVPHVSGARRRIQAEPLREGLAE
mmetsp:Transcript_24703/g.76299  ORF Transcript_24703/g.76299 Transcript_24703/m.76299 type:complete len:250 (+) Transcript_24703:561-1310(+)